MSEGTIKVKRISIDGVKYVYDPKTNIVYDIESKEPIGVLSEDKKSIDLYDDDEEEEEEEDEDEEEEDDDEDDDEDEEIMRHLEQVAMDKKIRDIRKQGQKPVIPKPYPSDIQFTEKEQKFYDEDKKDIDDTARQLNNPKSGQVILIPDPMRREVSFKRASQMNWDKGIGRPYSYNEDLILTKMTDLKKLINDETDEAKKEQKKRMLQLLLPKLREGKEQDKVEGVAIEREQETMGQEEQQTREFLREERNKKEREEELERIRQRELIEAPKREARRKEYEARQKELEMMGQEDKTQKDMIKSANILKYGIERRFSPDWRIGEEARVKNIEAIVKEYNEYRNIIKAIPSYSTETAKKFKNDVKTNVDRLKKEVIVSLFERKRGLDDQIKRPTIYADGGDNETKKGIKRRDEFVADSQKKLEVVKKLLRDNFTKEEMKVALEEEKEAKKTRPTLLERLGKGIVDNPELYEKAKQIADEKYKKPSAYKSGFIIKKYKELGGTYSGEKPKTTGIARWFKEEWKDIGNAEYPVYRPTKRITIETPLTPDEIKPSNLKKQIALKQEIKGDANLPPFEKKTGGKVIPVGIALDKISEYDEIWKYSNPKKVAEMAEKYLGKDDAKFVFRSSKPKKKYMVYDKKNEKWVYFGEMGYEDFTKHQDEKRRENYLKRTANMKGDWKDNKYSANNLSRNILW